MSFLVRFVASCVVLTVAEKSIKAIENAGGFSGIKQKVKGFFDQFDSSKNLEILKTEVRACLDHVLEQQKIEGREWTQDEVRDYVAANVKPRHLNELDKVLLNMSISFYLSAQQTMGAI